MLDYRPRHVLSYSSNRERGFCLWKAIMRARQLIDNASFGPDALKVMGEAFDAAWAEIAGNFGNDPVVVEAARIKLANAILSVANEGSRGVEALKQAALEVMASSSRP